jgi:hypothetical protein
LVIVYREITCSECEETVFERLIEIKVVSITALGYCHLGDQWNAINPTHFTIGQEETAT